MVAAEHVLGVARVALAPGFVVEGVDEAGAVVALVEGGGDEAVGFARGVCVPGADYLAADGRHGFFGL